MLNQTVSNVKVKKITNPNFWKFILLSMIGVFLFMIPVPYGESTNLVIGIIKNWVRGLIPKDHRSAVAVGILSFAAIVTIINAVIKPKFIRNSKLLNSTFSADYAWGTIRVLSSVFGILALYKIGPEFFWADSTGGMLLNSVLPSLWPWFVVCGLFLPFLTSFGAMEFGGIVLRPIWRPLFTLPGRSSVDCVSSILGSSTVGAVLTDTQYEGGYYTRREGYIIATCFSVASYPGCVYSCDLVGMMDYFGIFYLSVIVCTVVCAFILPRTWPLKNISMSYHNDMECQLVEDIPEGMNIVEYAVQSGMASAEKNSRLQKYLQDAGKFVLSMVFNTVPAVMTLGVIGLIICNFTPVFEWISYPFYLLLDLCKIPDARLAAPSMLVGFTYSDLPMFMAMAKGITSPMTMFVIWVVSYSQIIYMSGVGAVLMASHMKIKFSELLIVFLLRTAISFPIVMVLAHIFF